jgi:hypothetical protein
MSYARERTRVLSPNGHPHHIIVIRVCNYVLLFQIFIKLRNQIPITLTVDSNVGLFMLSIFFWPVCRRRNASSSHGLDTTAAELGIQTKDFKIPWTSALVVAALCAIFLACSYYRRRYKPIVTAESQPLNLQRQGSPSQARDERKPPRRNSSAQRRLSSRGSPIGWSLEFTSYFLLFFLTDVESHISLRNWCCSMCYLPIRFLFWYS